MTVEKFLSPFIEAQFPAFYKDYGPNFVAFVKAYYEWIETSGNPVFHQRRLYEYFDVDFTADDFIKYFKNKYMLSLPDDIMADKRLLLKHILDLYKSKGSQRSYELLFRILFNEDIQVYIPGNDVFKLSDNQWHRPIYIEVTDSIYLNDLIGRQITSSSGNATAIVENYSTKIVNNKVLNILALSSLDGEFNYGHRILCFDLYINDAGTKISLREYEALDTEEKVDYDLAITTDNAPVIFGSLSSLGIINGGANFHVGELLNISNNGIGGVARVASVTDQAGKVSFKLIDGGDGFSVNAVVSVTGGFGTGATFTVGGIVDKEIFYINTDIINPYYNAQLDISSSGFKLNVASIVGTFTVGHTLNSTAATTVLPLDVTVLVANSMAIGESLSNATLGISNMRVVFSDGSYVKAVGTGIVNANLVTGAILVSNTTASRIQINTVLPTQSVWGNGIITSANSTVLEVNTANGYYLPLFGVTDANSGATANVTTTTRKTDWVFPGNASNTNLDTLIGQGLTFANLEVGTISFLTNVDPGSGYASDPTADVIEPSIAALNITSLSHGGIKGHNAVIEAIAGSAVGIVTAVDIYDSGLGYDPYEVVQLQSSNAENQTVITGTTVVDLTGRGAGFFKNRHSFLSDTQHVIDSQYWQNLSYDILAPRMLSSYEQFLRDLVHPAGVALYGTYKLISTVDDNNSAVESTTLTQQ